jgi:hypothetical protein
MKLPLTPTEAAALIELLRAEIDGTRFPHSPRLRPLRSILAKLARVSAPAPTYPPPKPPGEPSAVLHKKRRR